MLFHEYKKESKELLHFVSGRGRRKKHNFVNKFLVKWYLKITDKEKEFVNDRICCLNLRGRGAGCESCSASRYRPCSFLF
jgi:hypothetical protein